MKAILEITMQEATCKACPEKVRFNGHILGRVPTI